MGAAVMARPLSKEDSAAVALAFATVVAIIALQVAQRYRLSSVLHRLILILVGAIVLALGWTQNRRTRDILAAIDGKAFLSFVLPPIAFYAGVSTRKGALCKDAGKVCTIGIAGSLMTGVILTASLAPVLSISAQLSGEAHLPSAFRQIHSWQAAYQSLIAAAAGLRITPTAFGRALKLGAIFSFTDANADVLGSSAASGLRHLLANEAVVSMPTSVAMLHAVAGVDAISARICATVMLRFGWIIAASTLLGVASGLWSAFVIKHLFGKRRQNSDADVLMIALVAVIAYALAEAAQLAGVVSVLVCGVVMRHYTWHSMNAGARAFVLRKCRLLAGFAETVLLVYVGFDLCGGFLPGHPFPSVVLICHALGVAASLLLLVAVARALVLAVAALVAYACKADRMPVSDALFVAVAGYGRGGPLALGLVYKCFARPGGAVFGDRVVVLAGVLAVLASGFLALAAKRVRRRSHDALETRTSRLLALPALNDDLLSVHTQAAVPSMMSRAWRAVDRGLLQPLFGGPEPPTSVLYYGDRALTQSLLQTAGPTATTACRVLARNLSAGSARAPVGAPSSASESTLMLEEGAPLSNEQTTTYPSRQSSVDLDWEGEALDILDNELPADAPFQLQGSISLSDRLQLPAILTRDHDGVLGERKSFSDACAHASLEQACDPHLDHLHSCSTIDSAFSSVASSVSLVLHGGAIGSDPDNASTNAFPELPTADPLAPPERSPLNRSLSAVWGSFRLGSRAELPTEDPLSTPSDATTGDCGRPEDVTFSPPFAFRAGGGLRPTESATPSFIERRARVRPVADENVSNAHARGADTRVRGGSPPAEGRGAPIRGGSLPAASLAERSIWCWSQDLRGDDRCGDAVDAALCGADGRAPLVRVSIEGSISAADNQAAPGCQSQLDSIELAGDGALMNLEAPYQPPPESSMGSICSDSSDKLMSSSVLDSLLNATVTNVLTTSLSGPANAMPAYEEPRACAPIAKGRFRVLDSGCSATASVVH